jgi:hypothetical protein
MIKRNEWSPTGKARGTSMFFGGIRRSIPSYAQGFGGLSCSHSSTAIGRAWTPECLASQERFRTRRRLRARSRFGEGRARRVFCVGG